MFDTVDPQFVSIIGGASATTARSSKSRFAIDKGKHYSLDWTWILDWTGLWTGLLKRCIFGAIALPKRPVGHCHAPWKPKH